MKEIIITSSVLILCITVIRALFKGKISSRFQYALWLLVVLRLVIPVSAQIDLPLGFLDGLRVMNAVDDMESNGAYLEQRLAEQMRLNVDSGSIMYRLIGGGAADSAYQPTQNPDEPLIYTAGQLAYGWLDILCGIWIVGMIVVAAWILITNILFSHRLKKGRRNFEPSADVVETLRKRMPEKIRKMKLYTVEDLASPCLYGLPGREAIYLLPDMAKEPEKLCHVLTHEFCHKKHGDSFWSLLRSVLLTVYWFHPLVWVAAVLSKRDCELACDEAALEFLGEEERVPYGETLLSIITRKGRLSDIACTATTMTGSGKSVKERIKLIVQKPKILGITVAVVVALVAVVFVMVFTQSRRFSGGMVLGQEEVTVTADMQVTLPASIGGISGYMTENDGDDIVIYQVKSNREAGRFSKVTLGEAIALVDAGQKVTPLGYYGYNYLLREYMGPPALQGGMLGHSEVTTHNYTSGEEGSASHMGVPDEGSVGVPGTDSNAIRSDTYLPTEEGSADVPETDSNSEADSDDTTYNIDDSAFLPAEEMHQVSVSYLPAEEIREESVDYLPNEQITTVAQPSDARADKLGGPYCFIYVKADYSGLKDKYLAEMEFINKELESIVDEVVVLSINREFRDEIFDAMIANRTEYLGDNSRVGALLNALPVPSALNYVGGFALQTAQRPYTMRINYELSEGNSLEDVDTDMVFLDAALLFACIGNVDEISFDVNQEIVETYYRAEMQEKLGSLDIMWDSGDEDTQRGQLELLHDAVVKYLNDTDAQ